MLFPSKPRYKLFGTTYLAIFVALGIGVLGCNKSPYNATVTGIVTLDGETIGPGVIQFLPAGQGGNPATGTIQVDGSYQLKTSNAVGLNPGQYKVTIAVYDQPDVALGERAAPGSAPLRTPEKYLSSTTTDLEYSVEQGPNTLDIALTSAD